MNYKHVARVYLNWFEQEAHNLHAAVCDTAGPFIWNDDETYLIGYTGAEGFRSYQGFVKDLAQSRLTPAQAERVLIEDVALVTGVKVN